MNETKSSSFQFKGYRIERSVIELKAVEIGENFSISFNPKGIINKAESSFQLNLTIYIKDKEMRLTLKLASYPFLFLIIKLQKTNWRSCSI